MAPYHCLSEILLATRCLLRIIHHSARLSPHPLIVNGDINHLQQCLLNLIFNGIESMAEGGQMHVTSKRDKANGNAVVEIRDTGSGIAKENLALTFEPFFSTKEEGEGTGLGLSIVYGIVKNHHGDIRVESREGKGSTFLLSFPLR
jgi:two-component system NtrC family sensor kinase